MVAIRTKSKEFTITWAKFAMIMGALASIAIVADSTAFHFIIAPWATHAEIQKLQDEMVDMKRLKMQDHKLLVALCNKEGIPVPEEAAIAQLTAGQ